MEKLVIYDLNLQRCDDYQIQKELNNRIVLSSDDEEELVVDDDEDDTLEAYRVSQDDSQNCDPLKYIPLSKTNAVPNLTMNLRPRKNNKSLSYLDLRPDTPTDSESDEDQDIIENNGKSFDDFCQKLSNGNDCDAISKINATKLQEEDLEDIDVGTYDFLQENLTSSTVESNSFQTPNKFSRIDPQNISDDIILPLSIIRRHKRKSETSISDLNKNLKECLRRQKLKELLTDLEHMIPSLEEGGSSMKEILDSASFLCRRLEYECKVWQKLKTEQMKINKKLGEKLKEIIAETVF